jgi:hypothetical protein
MIMDHTPYRKKLNWPILHAGGLSQRETMKEFHHRHPTKPQPQEGNVPKLIKLFR